MLFALQRLSALILAPLVVGHLVVILYAVRGGLTAGEILARTQGSPLWGGFYGLFAVAVAVHAPIGLRTVLREWTPLPDRLIDPVLLVFAALLLGLGLRAVYAVTGGGA